MYVPAHFQQTDARLITALVREHPLAMLVSMQPQGLAADPLPMLLDPPAGGGDGDGAGTLVGHVARANPLWRHAQGQAVLAIFSGPQAYISPGWYPSKAAHGKVVPTWNYATVHLHGRLRAIEDPVWLRRLVERLTGTHESGRLPAWSVGDAPDDYIDAMLAAIVGIEIVVTRVEAKWKLSQNRSAADRAGVVNGLGGELKHPARVVADWVAGAGEQPAGDTRPAGS